MSGDRERAARMAIELAKAWEDGERAQQSGTPRPRPSHCGGAYVRVTEQEAQEIRQAKRARYLESDIVFPADGSRIELRVFCNQDVEPNKGLCSWCSGIEALNRALMRKATRPKQSTKSFRTGTE